jgi:hypothetical protein
MTDSPTFSAYLGDNLYADFPGDLGLIRVWAMADGQESLPLYLSPESLAALMNYAARCYAAAFGVIDDQQTHH